MTNIYFIGMCVSMVIYVIIGFVVSKSVKNAEDFYVAGRRAPVFLIAGSMIASYTSTGMFMGDAAQCYEGAFSPIILFAGMQSAGYIIGAVFFGRYLRRSHIMTIPEFFGKRFHSNGMKKLAALTAIITMSVYLLSVIQGIGTLMNIVTGVDYNICIIIAMIVFTLISISSGASGVLITDTLMAAVFTVAMLLAMGAISKEAGGWFAAIKSVTEMDPALLSWGGSVGDGSGPGPLGYSSQTENLIWGLTYGVVWMSVCMVGPWQSSRYLMAKNEHTVIRSAFIAAVGVFLMEFLTGMAAVMVNVVNPDIDPASNVLIWAAMHMMPTLLGVILLTGVLAAGISSATTFLSLIGASVANDIMNPKSKVSIRVGQIAMAAASVVVIVVAVLNPPSIFWIMFLGGAIVASSWMPVAVASIFSRRVTKAGAFAGMLFGFLGCFVLRLAASLMGLSLPAYLDPSIVGIVCNLAAMTIVSAFTKVTPEEKEARANLFVIPEEEKEAKEVKKTLRYTKWSVLVGGTVFASLLVLWIIPYLTAKF